MASILSIIPITPQTKSPTNVGLFVILLSSDKIYFHFNHQNFGGLGGGPPQLHPGVCLFIFFSFITFLLFLLLASIGATALHKRAIEIIHAILFFILFSPLIIKNKYFIE